MSTSGDKRYTRNDVEEFEGTNAAGQLVVRRAIYRAPGCPVAIGIKQTTDSGNVWWTCWVEAHERVFDSFEFTGTSHEIGEILSQEVRVFANDPAEYRP